MRRRKFTEEKFKIFLEMYNKGASDREIADALGFAKTTIRYWRLKLNLPANPSPTVLENWNKVKHYRACAICGKPFLMKSPHQKYCKSCWQQKYFDYMRRYFFIRGIRKMLWEYINTGFPSRAKEIIKEMLEEEGSEFTKEVVGSKLLRALGVKIEEN